MHSGPALVQIIAHHESYDEIRRDDNGVEGVNRSLYRCVRILSMTIETMYSDDGDGHQIPHDITVKKYCES